MKRFIIIAVLLAACPLWAGEKEDFQKEVLIYQLQLQNLQLQSQLINKEYPVIEAKLKEAAKRQATLDEKTKKEMADIVKEK